MADYPSQYVSRRRLRDGRTVTIRPIRADDGARTAAFVRRLSGETRYLRFQKWVEAPSDRLIHFLTDIDYDRHMALVAAAGRDDGGEDIVGEARFVANADGESCDLGIVIADDWHSSGLAGVLMDALMRIARAHGLRRMEGIVLATNSTMLRFMRSLGFRTFPAPQDRTIVRIEKRLLPPRAAS